MSFSEIKKNFGFGCMRLPMKDGEVDYDKFNEMIDYYIDAGFNYFDTAHGYIDGKSEKAIRDCLAASYPRDKFILANKLSDWFVKTEEEVVPFFESQLELCGVEYFDFYLFHSINAKNYERHKSLNSFEIIKELKTQGKIKHIAMSFHDRAEVLDKILTEQPFIEAVQLQINYLDYDDPAVQSKACYDVAAKHSKQVIVMEPVKGGTLVNLPKEAQVLFDGLKGGSYASYALRYSASFENVFMTLSGMGSMEMMQDNVNTFADFVPLNENELAATDKARALIRKANLIPCTSCNYCADVCPKNIPISKIFGRFNEFSSAKITKGEFIKSLPAEGGKVSDCIKCGKCENVCPQNIKIREKLEKIVHTIE